MVFSLFTTPHQPDHLQLITGHAQSHNTGPCGCIQGLNFSVVPRVPPVPEPLLQGRDNALLHQSLEVQLRGAPFPRPLQFLLFPGGRAELPQQPRA